MGQSRHPGHEQPLPNYPGKQTFSAPAGMSEKCPTAGIHHGGGNVSLVPESPGILSGRTIAMRKQFRPTIKGYESPLGPKVANWTCGAIGGTVHQIDFLDLLACRKLESPWRDDFNFFSSSRPIMARTDTLYGGGARSFRRIRWQAFTELPWIVSPKPRLAPTLKSMSRQLTNSTRGSTCRNC